MFLVTKLQFSVIPPEANSGTGPEKLVLTQLVDFGKEAISSGAGSGLMEDSAQLKCELHV